MNKTGGRTYPWWMVFWVNGIGGENFLDKRTAILVWPLFLTTEEQWQKMIEMSTWKLDCVFHIMQVNF